jgi:hypothetical protein
LKRLEGMNSVLGFRYDRPDQIDSIKKPGFCFFACFITVLFFLICIYTDRDILYYTYIHHMVEFWELILRCIFERINL